MRTNIVRDERMTVSYDVVNGWTVVEVDGEVDLHTSPMVREAVIKLLSEGHRHFVLDLCFVPFMDSLGLGMVVAITKRIRERGGSLRITCTLAGSSGSSRSAAWRRATRSTTHRRRQRNVLHRPMAWRSGHILRLRKGLESSRRQSA